MTLRRKSAKRVQLERHVNPQRRAFLEAVGTCMVCRQAPAQDADEIASGYARESCLTEFQLVLATCRRCHDRTQHWRPAKRIALRIAWEIDQTCQRYCELKGLALTAIERDDVLTYLNYSPELQL